MARPTVVPDPDAAVDELDEELLPGGPEPALADDEDLRAKGEINADAIRGDVARTLAEADLEETETVTAPDGDAWVEGAQVMTAGEDGEETVAAPRPPQRRRVRRNPPPNLGPVEVERPVTLTLISLGRTIKNITCSLVFQPGYPIENTAALQGAHAHAGVFDRDYLGNGLTIKKIDQTTTEGDTGPTVTQVVKVQMPRFDGGVDQIEKYVLPLLPEELDLSSLMATSLPWRLNFPINLPGVLLLHAMQESFDLTGKDASDGTNEPV